MKLMIKGIPKSKQSVRSKIITKSNGEQFIGHYQDKKIIQEADNIRSQVVNQLPTDFIPFTKKLIIKHLHFVYPIPKSFNKKQLEAIDRGEIVYKGSKPDLMDNLSKGLFDALNGVLFTDDALIVESNDVKKYYGKIPMTAIEIEEIS